MTPNNSLELNLRFCFRADADYVRRFPSLSLNTIPTEPLRKPQRNDASDLYDFALCFTQIAVLEVEAMRPCVSI